ncbi:chromosome segregation ATPase [Pseudomonas cavernicola]|uniref:Chromosome segregation ATPase n=1 Tax=Pseudomonas cavernicola TaxID=2320866 RepID=A0A418XKL7_9PSED|nr:chromosome segregation ATPase [Pseudomonas cavernicola]RJG13028.1 chromosome segregation ATPase [Pseudomonas cavernicola]
MEYSEIEKLISLLGSFGIGAIIGGGTIYLFIKSFIPSYLSEKAKNLASKEDIKYITEKVESVKSDYAHLLEEARSSYQLKFAAVEREKNIKKEVYMEAVEAITRSQNIIAGFCNLNLSEEQITSSMSVDAGKVAKIQVVGSKETVRTVTDYMAEIGTASLDLMLKRSELMLRKSSIHTYESLRNKSQQEIDRYIAIMKNLNLQGSTDQSLWDTVSRNIEYEQGQFDKYQAELDTLWKTQNKEHLKFTRECMGRFFDISLLLPPAVLAVRNELDLEIASEDYLDIFNENINKGRRVFEAFLHRIEQGNI